MSCEQNQGKFVIPGKPIKVGLSQLRGDIGSGIMHEITDTKHLQDITSVRLKGDRVFTTSHDGLVFVSQLQEGKISDPNEETILIPGKQEEVDISRVHGDTESGIRGELTGSETYLKDIPLGDRVINTVLNGGRAFLTENDDFLFVDPSPKV